MKVKFTIMGPPKGKGRPRFQRIGNYTKVSTPPDTVNYENLVKIEYELQCRKYYFGNEELGVKLTTYYPIAKSTSKKKREQMINDEIKPTKKPDCDNVLKIVCDSLNQIAYKDDAQIVESHVYKKFAEIPRVEVEIYDISDPDTLYDGLKPIDIEKESV